MLKKALFAELYLIEDNFLCLFKENASLVAFHHDEFHHDDWSHGWAAPIIVGSSWRGGQVATPVVVVGSSLRVAPRARTMDAPRC